MSNLSKSANTEIPLSPEEQYEASQLFGKSLFSAMQLAKEQELRKKMMERSMNEANVLRVPIPENLLPSHKVAEDMDAYSNPGLFARALKMQNNPVRMLAGGQTGFRDAKKEYYMQEKAQIQKELMRAQKEYIDTLTKIKTGSDNEDTPCVDAFCNGIAHMALFGKTAADDAADVPMEEGSVRRLMGNVMDVAKKPFQPAIDTAAGGLMSTGAGAAYLTYLLRKRMREEPDKYMDETLPTRVELEPYKV
jgi:hypothetical protein